MKTLCQPGADGLCTQCGGAVPPKSAKTCAKGPRARTAPNRSVERPIVKRRAPKPKVICPHLLDPTGENVPVKNCGCGAVTALFDCELHGLCAPFALTGRAWIEKPGITLCRDCQDNPANATIPT